MRHFCALATGLGWVSLFQNALKIAASYGITISDVVLELEKELKEAPSLEDGALAPEMTAYLEQSSQAEGTFWVGRRLNPTRKGELVMWASSNFKAQVASEEALRAQWRRVGDDGSGGTTALWDAFVHPDDRSVIPMALGRVIATMPSFDPDVIGSKCEETTGLVRILMLQPGRGAAVTNVGLEPPARIRAVSRRGSHGRLSWHALDRSQGGAARAGALDARRQQCHRCHRQGRLLHRRFLKAELGLFELGIFRRRLAGGHSVIVRRNRCATS